MNSLGPSKSSVVQENTVTRLPHTHFLHTLAAGVKTHCTVRTNCSTVNCNPDLISYIKTKAETSVVHLIRRAALTNRGQNLSDTESLRYIQGVLLEACLQSEAKVYFHNQLIC